MKSYGKPDESWDDAKFRAIIEDALEMTRESRKTCAVRQDRHGNVAITKAKRNSSHVYACWAYTYRNKKSREHKLELIDNVEYHDYSVEQMVPRMRDVLTKGIVEYGRLGFLSEGYWQMAVAIACAEILLVVYREPFIVGLTDSGITVAPISERGRFVEQAACVVAKHGCWSLADRISDMEAYRHPRPHVQAPRLKGVTVSDRRSMRLSEPAIFLYDAIWESRGQKRMR